MSVIWEILIKYGQTVRECVLSNNGLMKLLQNEWALHEDKVIANQGQSLVVMLKHDDVLKVQSLDGWKDNEVLCPCGDVLKLVEAKNCYPPSAYNYLYCDYCRLKIDWGVKPDEMVYHCKKKEGIHPHGFDLCCACAKRKFIIDAHKKKEICSDI